MFNGNAKNAVCIDIQENKGAYAFLTGAWSKINSFEISGLATLRGPRKKGDPKNAGISVDVCENKGQKFRDRAPV